MKINVLMSIKDKRIHSGRELIPIYPVILSPQKCKAYLGQYKICTCTQCNYIFFKLCRKTSNTVTQRWYFTY